MKRVYMLSAFIAVVALALTGCGGGGGGNSPNDPTDPISISISPTTSELYNSGNTQIFTAIVSGASDSSVTWEVVEGATGGTITPLTTNTARYTAHNSWNTFHIKVTSVEDPTKYATATIKIVPVSISISPTTATLGTGGTRTFTATVTGPSNLAVTWQVEEGSEGGTITTLTASTARYTAPDVWNTFHVKVTSQADPTKSATATVTVGPPGPPD